MRCRQETAIPTASCWVKMPWDATRTTTLWTILEGHRSIFTCRPCSSGQTGELTDHRQASCQDIQCNVVTVETWPRPSGSCFPYGRGETVWHIYSILFRSNASIKPFDYGGSFSVSPTFRYGDAVHFRINNSLDRRRNLLMGVAIGPEEIDILLYPFPGNSEGNHDLRSTRLTIGDQVFTFRDADQGYRMILQRFSGMTPSLTGWMGTSCRSS